MFENNFSVFRTGTQVPDKTTIAMMAVPPFPFQNITHEFECSMDDIIDGDSPDLEKIKELESFQYAIENWHYTSVRKTNMRDTDVHGETQPHGYHVDRTKFFIPKEIAQDHPQMMSGKGNDGQRVNNTLVSWGYTVTGLKDCDATTLASKGACDEGLAVNVWATISCTDRVISQPLYDIESIMVVTYEYTHSNSTRLVVRCNRISGEIVVDFIKPLETTTKVYNAHDLYFGGGMNTFRGDVLRLSSFTRRSSSIDLTRYYINTRLREIGSDKRITNNQFLITLLSSEEVDIIERTGGSDVDSQSFNITDNARRKNLAVHYSNRRNPEFYEEVIPLVVDVIENNTKLTIPMDTLANER